MNTETIKQGSNEDSRVRKEPLSFDDLRKLLDSDDKIVKNQLHLFMWRLKESYGAEFPFKCQPCFEEKELSGPTVQSVWKLTFPTRDDLTIINCTDFDLSVGDDHFIKWDGETPKRWYCSERNQWQAQDRLEIDEHERFLVFWKTPPEHGPRDDLLIIRSGRKEIKGKVNTMYKDNSYEIDNLYHPNIKKSELIRD